MLCFKKLPVAKKVMDKRWEYPNFPPKNFGLSAEKRRRDPFSLSLFSGIKNVWMRGWGEECQEIPSKFPCLTVPKNAVGEPFSPSLISGIEKVWIRWRGQGEESQDIPSKIPCLTVPKNAVGEPFNHSLFSGIEKIWIRGGEEEEGSINFSVESFCFTMPKIFVGNLLCCVLEKFRQRKSLWIRRGVSRFSVENFLSDLAETFRR